MDFYSGLTVVTGETGSGKSIIIDALMYVFGARASRDIVRTGTLAANFEAVFQLSHPEASDWLRDNDLLDLDNQDSIICRRSVDSQGKSKIQINGHSVTVAQIRILGDYVLDIHTQHASITLLKSDTQRNLLDEFCGIGFKVSRLGTIYRQIQELETKLKLAVTAIRDLELKREILSSKISELSALNLHDGEWEAVQQEHKELSNAGEVLGELDYVVNYLADGEQSLVSINNELHTRLSKVSQYAPKIAEALKIVESVGIELQELDHEINSIVRNISQDPERLSELELRMDEIFAISRKHRIDASQIPQVLQDLELQLGQLDQDSDISKLEEQLAVAIASYNELAAAISDARKTGSGKLGKSVTQLLHGLAISGEFSIGLSAIEKISSYGLENIEYQVCFNQGMPLQTLSSAASGGELSRVALALYLLLSTHNPPEVIIFDEIDVGIGGKVAAVVGQMLAELGSSKQVICITHQPQAASYGVNHLVVSKMQSKNTTLTKVDYVEHEDRINEIARMLGGVHITDATLVHAKEMLSQHSLV